MMQLNVMEMDSHNKQSSPCGGVLFCFKKLICKYIGNKAAAFGSGWMLPVPLMVGAVLYALALGAGMFLLATQRPWLGLNLRFDSEAGGAVVMAVEGPAAGVPVGAVVRAVQGEGEPMEFVASDFVPETDGAFATYGDYEVFLKRQTELARIMAAPSVTLLGLSGQSWQVSPEASRPWSALPPDFWVQVAVGLLAWLIAAGVWVFRQHESSARYLLLSGWSTAVFAPFAAVYSTRELALPGELFRWLTDLNFMGGSLFAGTLVALLTCYPRRVGPRWLGWVAVGSQLAWFVAQEVGAFESMVMARRLLVMVALVATFVLSAWQWRCTRGDPVGRAALRWFLLSWVVGTSVFALLILLPQMFGVDTSAMQGYAFLLFLLVYAGLAFGILRFRLFGLDEWWVRIAAWLGALALLVVLDLLFLMGLGLSAGMSMSLTLVICGVVWLPLRGWLSAWFLPRSGASRQSTFRAVVDVALAPRAEDRAILWRECLRTTFDPLHIEPAETTHAAVGVEEDGLCLRLPAVGDAGAWRLKYARGGRSLFGPRDAETAAELAGMLRHVIDSRHAYERGVRVERDRIARDIHDNIGAQLLSALHSREADRREIVLREALADLRGIINDAANPALGLEEALADLRHETADRAEAAGLALAWSARDDRAGDAVPPKVLNVLRPLLRESVSNVLKHARARRVLVEIRREAAAMVLVVEDDGVGFDPGSIRPGHGLGNLRARAASLNGSVHWSSGSDGKGACATFILPLESANKES